MKSLFLLYIISILFSKIISASVIVPIINGSFPDVKNINNSNTITTETCPERMSLFPVDENSTKWVCDCSFPSDLYYSGDDSCYTAYSRGPCPPEHFLVLPKGEQFAKCEKNSCLEDGLVPFNGTCATIGSRSSTCLLDGYLVITGENYQLVCVFYRKLNIIKAPPKLCPPGSRRNNLGNCKAVIQ